MGGLGYSTLGYGYRSYGYPAYGYYGKRSADAEPEADAYYGYGLGYRTLGYGYRSYGYPAYGYYGKRSADAEPEADADAYYGYGLGYSTRSKVALDLSVLGKIKGSNLLSLFNLLLVRLDLALELVNQSLHSLMILSVFILRVGKLLDLALRLAEILQAVSIASVLSIKVRFKLTDASVHSSHGFLASLKGIGLSLINSSLHVFDLSLKKSLFSLKSLGKLLLRSELISKTSSINHGTLSLLFRKGSFSSHLITVSLEGLDLRLKLSLGSLDGLVGAGLVRKRLIGVLEFLLNHTAGTVSLLKK